MTEQNKFRVGILAALGAEDESAAMRTVAETNEFLDELRGVTGKDTFASILAFARETAGLSRDVETATGKPANQAIGVVLAWKSAAEQNPKLEERVAAVEEDLRKRDVRDLVDRGKKEGKLTPATATFWETRSPSELEAFLAVAPRVIPVEVKPTSGAPSNVEKNAAGRIADAQGRTYEQIRPAERAEMKRTDPALYEAMREDWQSHGSPANNFASN